MKETRFIAQNKEKWQESENLLSQSEKDPEKLSNLFTQVIDDLSYSRTYYPNRSVRVYLNNIARAYFSLIYKHKTPRKNAFLHFWADELPQIVYHSRKPLLISLIIFLMSAAIGVFSSVKDPQFTSSILGERYVAMTEANIEKGDPMAVYKEAHEVNMFLGITLNNLFVAFRTYVFGVFLSIGTIAILLYNGIMVGCFQFFFIERGVFVESALTIWLHGTLEISSIILAGGAGLTLGSGFLFPGTYSRLQAFQITAIRSLKLMLGITPIFVLAGLIESFLTRYTDAPDLLRLVLILLSAAFIAGYFIIYPWMKHRSGFDRPLAETRIAPESERSASIDRIKNNGEILKDTFQFYRRFAGRIFAWVALVTLFTTAAEFFLAPPRAEPYSWYEPWLAFLNNLYYGMKTPSFHYLAINGIGSALIVYYVHRLMTSEYQGVSRPRFRVRAFVQTLMIVSLLYMMLWGLGPLGVVIAILGVSFLLLFSFSQHYENTHIIRALLKSWKLSGEGFGQAMGLQLIVVMMSFSFLLLLSAPVLYMSISILQWNFAESDTWVRSVLSFIETFAKLFVLNLIIPVFAISAAYLYFSAHEVLTAENLTRAIARVGQKNIRSTKL